MAFCPTCAAPIGQNLDVFFCEACQASLQPPDMLASTLAVPAIEVTSDRFANAMGRCPGCEGGQLRGAHLLGEIPGVCDGCGALWLTRSQLARMRARGARDKALVPSPSFQTYAERFEKDRHVAYDDVATNLYAYPAVVIVGVLAHGLGLSFLVWGTVEMWFHELGHAIIAWLSGFVAVPLPFFTMMPRETRSGWVILIVLGMIGAIAYESAKRRLWGLVAFAAGLFATQLFLTVILDLAQARQWFLFAGQAGAIVLPTLVMVLFYQPLGWRWDFWRYPVLAVASIGFLHALFIWTNVARGTGPMPHGSAVGDDAEGDMETLIREFQWTKTSLANCYIGLTIACLIVLAATYTLFLRRAYVKNAAPRT